MNRLGRTGSLLLTAAVLVVVVAVPAFGQDDDTSGGTATTVAEESGLTPAVPVPEIPAEEIVPDWTYRYLIPTGLALAAVIILLTSIQYFTRVVRKRYRIVEE